MGAHTRRVVEVAVAVDHLEMAGEPRVVVPDRKEIGGKVRVRRDPHPPTPI